MDAGQELVGRRVQRRAAVEHPRAHAFKEGAHAVPVDDREHAAQVEDLANALGALLDLLVHVGDVEPRHGADAVEQVVARSGSSVWTWIFSVWASPTTSTESPIRSSRAIHGPASRLSP